MLVAALPAAGEAQATVDADSAAGPRIGDRLQLRARLPDRRAWWVDCDGRLAARAADTLVIATTASDRVCPHQLYPANTVARLRVAGRDRGSRLAHAGIGALIGAVVAGTVAYITADQSCRRGECGEGEGHWVAGAFAVIGGFGGGALGAGFGALVPAGRQWERVARTGPVRVTDAAPDQRQGRDHPS